MSRSYDAVLIQLATRTMFCDVVVNDYITKMCMFSCHCPDMPVHLTVKSDCGNNENLIYYCGIKSLAISTTGVT